MRTLITRGALLAAVLAAWPAFASAPVEPGEDPIAELEAQRVREIIHAVERLRHRGDYAGALEFYRKGLALRPSSVELRDMFSRLGMALAAESVLKSLDSDVVLAFFAEYEAWLGDENVEPSKFWWLRAVLLRRNGQDEEADALVEKALTYKPEDASYHWQIALYLLDAGFSEEAIEEYNHGLPHADNDWLRGNYTIGLAVAHVQLEHYEQGVEYYEQTFKLLGPPAPNNTLNRIYADAARACQSLGRYHELRGEHEKTVEANQRALDFQPDRLDDTMTPGFAANHHAMGEAYLKLGEPQKALEHLQRAVDMLPDAPGFYSTLGDAYAALDQPDKATETYEKCVKLYRDWMERRPDSGTPRNGLAWHYVTHDEHLDEALELSKKSLELAPDTPEYLDTLAEIYHRMGDEDKAIEWIKKALELTPKPKHIIYYEQQLAKFEKAKQGD